MKYIILTLAFAAAQALAHGKPDIKTPPDVKTPSTGPKTPGAPSAPSRSPQSRSDTVDRPCDLLIDAPFWCQRP